MLNAKTYNQHSKYVASYNREGRYTTVADIEKTSVNVLNPIIFVIYLTDGRKKAAICGVPISKYEYVENRLANMYFMDWRFTSPSSSASINKARSVEWLSQILYQGYLNMNKPTWIFTWSECLLGYEVAVSTAARLLEFSGRKINRVNSLDPAYYSINDETRPNRLLGEQAQFVDVVHTNLNRTNG
ncbi:hypothetical protein NQ317_019897 [Molorchus minor]|uniref:Lipase domain-containing protein n=1 Tax=Molorchus minor TaxID=1323400 RepID=A0ABQ9J7J3_9CUCU|nr:hypothetical protein NQ317_019897 [Molorchus minor]